MATGFQRIESLFIFVLACAAYHHYGFSWILFFILILAPDVFFAGYLIDPKIGARIYNIGHIYAAPVILLLLHYLAGMPQAPAISLIWTAHIAFDRVLGFGLKYDSGFRDTHLGKLNR